MNLNVNMGSLGLDIKNQMRFLLFKENGYVFEKN